MKEKAWLVSVLIAGLVFPGVLGAVQAALPDPAGIWAGKLAPPTGEIELIFKISSRPDGGYTALLDVPVQGAKDIPVSKVVFQQDGLVRLEIELIGAVFEGRFSPDGTEIGGHWRQMGAGLPLVLHKTEQPPALRRPQEPRPPYPYRAEEVVYANEKAGVRLAGTLTIPPGAGPHPAAILISGSGAQDRDETIMGHRPFLVLADYLTRRGFAVLRADDRGVGGSTGEANTATTADLAEDALAGVGYLKARPEIDPGRIALVGHSEGGLVAVLAAARAKEDVACLVLLAAPGIPGEELILRQTELILRTAGAPEEVVRRERRLQERLFAVLKEEKDPAAAAGRLQAILRDYLASLSAAEKEALAGREEAFMQSQMGALLTPWFRFFLTYDPRPALRELTCPVLALNGEKDLQVPAAENLPQIEAALRAGGVSDFTVKVLPGLNHLFQTCKTGSPAEYGQIEETFSPAALTLIGDWRAGHLGR
ncbi:MAG: alpha/beta hydrolase [Firmicutes bacterium]|nr:alpha/beta hydrolase [Bacillota bacterium]